MQDQQIENKMSVCCGQGCWEGEYSILLAGSAPRKLPKRLRISVV
jgi:hypothetical protein